MKTIKDSKGERFVLLVNEIFLIILSFIMLYPLLNTIAVSFSNGAAADSGRVYLWPVGFQTNGWQSVIRDRTVYRSFLNSIYVTTLGVFASLFFTALFAYPLSKPYFKYRKVISIMVVLTMVIRYPLIPYFLVVRSYGLLNNIHVLIITQLIVEYNLIVVRTFFQNIPRELEEAAFVEGANQFQIFKQLYIPLSKPVLATVGLFFAVTYWNIFLHALLFLRDSSLMPIQVRLRQFISMNSGMLVEMGVGSGGFSDLSRTSIQAAVTIFATIPILVIYPFLQKYFVKGALVGSIKG